MKTKEIIKILWEGPFKIEEILEDNIDHNKYEATIKDDCLYQVYDNHPLYGSEILVYIGIMQNKHEFTKDSWIIDNKNSARNVKIYLGKILSDSKYCIQEEINLSIKKAEALMIYALKPVFNCSNIQNVKDFSEDYNIYNFGNHRRLYQIFESSYLLKEPTNIDTVETIVKELELVLRR